MDSTQLINTAITAVVAVCVKELVMFAAKHSITLTKKLRALATAIFRRHWRLTFVLFDVAIILMSAAYLLSAFGDKSLATRGFVVMALIMAFNIYSYGHHLMAHSISYLDSVRGHEAIQNTRA